MKSSQNHFCPFSSLKNFTLSNLSKCSIPWSTCYNGLINHLDQVAQVGEQVNLIKVPQNHSCPEPNLNNSTLETISFWSQLLWTCSESQIMTLHQVMHQVELFCMTRSWKNHFCWFLGFTKVALATLPKWTQPWWNLLLSHAIWPCQASWQEEFIFLPKSATHSFCHFTKTPVLTTNTILLELNSLPQLPLILSYLQ